MFYVYADGESLWFPLDDKRVILNPRLTLEMGKAGSFQFSLPPSNSQYNTLTKLKTIITVTLDDTEIFRGRILTMDRSFNNVKQIYCEGVLAYLNDSVQPSEKFTGKTHDLFAQIIEGHNKMVEPAKQFKMGKITAENRDIIITGTSDETEDGSNGSFDYKQIAINAMTGEWKSSWEFISSYLIAYAGGYLRARQGEDGLYIDYLQDYESRAPQKIELGTNLLDFSESISAENLFTVLIPLGDENLTIAAVNNGSVELQDEALVKEYGRIVRTHVFDSVNQPETLLENGKRYLESYANVPVTIEIKAVDLHFANPSIQEIYVGDQVLVRSAPHGIKDYLTCTKIEYDFSNLGNTTYTFGDPSQSLTERYRKDKQKETEQVKQAASSGGGGAGKKNEKELDKVKSWVNYKPENPKVSIGALWETVNNTNKILSTVGINLDGETGNINIQALKTVQDADHNLLEKHESQIAVNANEIKLTSNKMTEEVNNIRAEITVSTKGLESQIKLQADNITAIGNNVEINTSNIYGVQENIVTINSSITSINSQITQVKKLIASEINAVKSDITWMHSKSIKAQTVSATNGMYCNTINISNSGLVGGSSIASQDWVLRQKYLKALPSHRHSVKVGSTTYYTSYAGS
jgi:hypothetical protein